MAHYTAFEMYVRTSKGFCVQWMLVGVSEALSVLAMYVEMQAVEGGLLTG